ncbi:MAG: DNA alkylation repair protein [Micrococcales bacterium]|nr:DNA alkylation repair protein [Micrococcales bacterium]
MAELLKDMYNPTSIGEIGRLFHSVYEPFQVDGFIASVLDQPWADLGLKDRVKKITATLGEYLPQDYPEALAIFGRALPAYTSGPGFFFPDFVEVFGQDEANWDISIAALASYTQYWSSEIAVRQFIVNDEKRMMAQMYQWSMDENEHLRRLASEGSRPQVPWGQALNSFKADPSPVLPILSQLKADPSQYVRKSVANNLNDISKTHPDLVVQLAKEWFGQDPKTDWMLKHACRTLLKRGNQELLALFGFDQGSAAQVDGFQIQTPSVPIGGELRFSFTVTASKEEKVRLEYGIDYVKANGKRSRKIFQLSESVMKPKETKTYTRRQAFADLSTRKHHPGIHSVTLIVNGAERGTLDFEVTS